MEAIVPNNGRKKLVGSDNEGLIIPSMKQRFRFILSLFFPVYLATVLLTHISLTGYWTDVILSVILSISVLVTSSSNSFTRTTDILCALLVFILFGLHVFNPFAWDTWKLRSFYYQPVDGRLFNAYFKPVGAYAGGYGRFWISETSKFFPVIEWRVYLDRSVDHDFNNDTFEDEPIDNNEVVRECIRTYVIYKQ